MSDSSATQIYFQTRELCHKDVYKHLADVRKSLLELKSVSKKDLLENTLFWQKEVERTKEEKDQEWLKRVNVAEAENTHLRTFIESLTELNESKPTNDHQLWEAKNEIDKLNRQLDEKCIHINRMQIAMAEQSKAMFDLEKSFALLYYRYKMSQHKENFKLRKLESKSEIGKGKLHSHN